MLKYKKLIAKIFSKLTTAYPLLRAKQIDSILNTNFFPMVYLVKKTLVNLFLQLGGPGGGRRKSFITELLRDGLDFPNTILQDGSR